MFNHRTSQATDLPSMDNLTRQTSALSVSDIASVNSTASNVDSKRRFNVAASQAFLPSSKPSMEKFSSIRSPNFSDIPSFVPSAQQESKFDPTVPAFESPVSPQRPYERQLNPYTSHHQSMDHIPTMNSFQQIPPMGGPQQQDFMFQSQQQSNYPLNYHLYAPTSNKHLHLHLKPNEQNAETLFIPNKLREALTKKNHAILQTMPQSSLPVLVGVYFNLVPLMTSTLNSESAYGYPNVIYKATSNTDGKAYALRRIENVNLEKDRSLSTVHSWIKLRHSNVAQVVDAFTTRAFGDNSLIIVYDFYPEAKTLYETYFMTEMGQPDILTMDILWSIMCQISAAISEIHSRDLLVRSSLHLRKVIITSKNRVRLSDCGVFDILKYSESIDGDKLALLKEVDLLKFGQLMDKLAQKMVSKKKSKTLSTEELLESSDLDEEFRKALKYLLRPPSGEPYTIKGLQQIICDQVFKELDRIQHTADFYELQLCRELENARIVRLMAKIDFLIDRPEYQASKIWGPTGERYPIKLFHQYLYHQRDSDGKPILDLAHILTNLNKLDAGIEERFLLIPPDEQTCLIVSYKEIKDLVEKSFRELTAEMSVS